MNRSGAVTSFDEVYETVAGVVAESLNLGEHEITPAAALQLDLGAKLIDLLEIVFRLERAFDIQIPRGEPFPESIFQGDPAFVSDGLVTDAGMAELRSRMPHADFDAFDHDRRLDAVPELFTVGLVTHYMAERLGIPAAPSTHLARSGQ